MKYQPLAKNGPDAIFWLGGQKWPFLDPPLGGVKNDRFLTPPILIKG